MWMLLCTGFLSLQRALVAVLCLVALWHVGTFPDQGLNLCPVHGQADCYPLYHQGSPSIPLYQAPLPRVPYHGYGGKP